MEKVEKLLLLVVLGAAMVIMAVMSFGSGEEPQDPNQPGTSIGNQDDEESAKRTQAPRIGERTDPGGAQSQRDIDAIVIKDGPGLDKSLLESDKTKTDPLGPIHPGENLAKSGDPSQGTVPPGASPGIGDGVVTEGNAAPNAVTTAEWALVPGEEAGIWVYTVQPKESLSVISQKITGSPANMHELISSYNEGVDLNRIYPGQKIQIPEHMIKGKAKIGAALSARSGTKPAQQRRHQVPGVMHVRPTPAVAKAGSAGKSGAGTIEAGSRKSAARTEDYVIRKGETLWGIAKKRVGERKAMAYVRQVRELNPDLDPAAIQPKDHILLPAR